MGLGGMMMSGMAFGAGSALMHSMFGHGQLGNGMASMFPVLASGGAGYVGYAYLFRNSPLRVPLTVGLAGTTFLVLRNNGEEGGFDDSI